MAKTAMRWNENETRLFVKLYISHKHLWDIEDEDYKSKHKRQEAYRDIATKFNALTNILLDESKVTMKIRSLRSTYSQEWSKIKSRPGYKTSLRWFDEWHKCSSHKQNDETTYDDQRDSKSNLEDSQNVWLEDEFENDGDLGNSPIDKAMSPVDHDYVLLLKNEPLENNEQPESSYKPRKRKLKSHQSSSDQPDSNSEEKEDEFDIYGKYIATQLRSMEIERALRVQLQIQNIVSEARIDSLTSLNT